MNRFLLIVLLLPIKLFAQIEVGVKAPELTLEGIYNRESGEVPTLASLRGKVVVLDFWATWCSPCVAAFPEYNRLSQKYKDEDVQFVAITDDPKEKLENFLGKREVDFWIGRDDDKKDFSNYKVHGRPQVYVINREGAIVYQGNKVTEELIEEALATNSISLPAEKETAKVITNGGFAPGEDPLYNGMNRMLGEESTHRPALIEHMIIRPSLETSFGGHAINYTKGHVGITYSGGDLLNIFKFLHSLSSTVWITNNTNDTSKYDIIYWKKTDGYTAAFSEIEQKLTHGLSLSLDTVQAIRSVNILSVNKHNASLKKQEEIEAGTSKLYTPVQIFISQLEEKSRQFYVTDETTQNLYIYNKGMEWKALNKAQPDEIIVFLKERGLLISKQTRTVKLYAINRK